MSTTLQVVMHEGIIAPLHEGIIAPLPVCLLTPIFHQSDVVRNNLLICSHRFARSIIHKLFININEK